MRSLEDRVRALEDERDVQRTLYTYGHSIDYGDEPAFIDCWTEDASLYWPPVEFHGRAQLEQAFRTHTHAPDVFHKHFLAEPRITLDGDVARVDSMFARLDDYEDGPRVLAFGRYLDTLVRCPDGRWRFTERRAEIESNGRPPEKIAALVASLMSRTA